MYCLDLLIVLFPVPKKKWSKALPNGVKKPKQITCDFFKVNVDRNVNMDFIGLVEHILKSKPDPKDRCLEIDEGFARIHGWQVGPDKTAVGCLLRVRTDQDARTSSREVDVIEDLDLPEGKLLTELFTFKYFGEHQIIAVHKNLFAGGHSRLSSYIDEMCGRPMVTFSPILSLSGYERVLKLKNIRMTEFRIAMPQNNTGVDLDDRSVLDVVNIGDSVGAGDIVIRFNARRNHPLADSIKSLIGAVVDRYGERVKSGRVIGDSYDMIEDVVINLIDDRCKERVIVDSAGPKIELADYYRAIDYAYSRRQIEIAQMYGPGANGAT